MLKIFNSLKCISHFLSLNISIDFIEILKNKTVLFFIWIGIISIVAVATVIADKTKAVTGSKRRISEKCLFFIAFIGGSVFMLLTMISIRHKTKHKRFMIGIPFIIILQTVVCFLIFNK